MPQSSKLTQLRSTLCARYFLTASQRPPPGHTDAGSPQGPAAKAPPAPPPPSQAATWASPSRMQALCDDVPAERVVSGCQGSPFKPRGPSRDILRLLGTPGHFGPPLLLNRITSYSLRVLIGQYNLWPVFESCGIWAVLFEGL